MKRELAILLIAVGFVAGCGGKNSTCVPGMSAACACSDGSSGAQACGGDGSYGACQCSRAVGGGSDGGSNTNSGPVAIVNASARAKASGGTTYAITFAIENAEWDQDSIERVEVIRYSWSGTTLTWSGGCVGVPWSVSAKLTSVIELDVTANSGAPQASSWVPCNNTYDATDVGMPATAPSGAIDLDIEGILSDAQPFKATATAPLL